MFDVIHILLKHFDVIYFLNEQEMYIQKKRNPSCLHLSVLSKNFH